jgi:hypothetical protein
VTSTLQPNRIEVCSGRSSEQGDQAVAGPKLLFGHEAARTASTSASTAVRSVGIPAVAQQADPERMCGDLAGVVKGAVCPER